MKAKQTNTQSSAIELIKVDPSAIIGGETVPAVNLRDLHQGLNVETQYKDWAPRRIAECMAVEGRDFLTLKFERQLPSGSKRQIDHLVTLDTAKHIAMLERSEEGRQIREYFIRVEKEFRAAPAPQISRREQLLKELADMDRGTIAVGVVDAIRPIHEYGSLAGNGKKRIGFRRAAWVADRRSRLEDALIIHREIREMDQIEFNLGLEGGDS